LRVVTVIAIYRSDDVRDLAYGPAPVGGSRNMPVENNADESF
jgi:hypothetical protein